MINPEIYQKVENLYNQGKREVIFILEDNTKEKHRIGKTAEGSIIYMIPHSRIRGRYLTDYQGLRDIQEVNIKPESEKWVKSIDKAIKLLSESGFFPDMLEDLKTAKLIGYEKLQIANKVLWGDYSKDYAENQKLRTKKIKDIDNRLIKENEDKNEICKTSILYYMISPLKIEKMNFGKYSNKEKLQQIKTAIETKTKISIEGDCLTAYDISFSYDGDKKAWYSKEYKGCGNGHYYLALNGEYALFYEDD